MQFHSRQPATESSLRARAAEESALSALIERHRSGDPGALNVLITALYPTVRRIVFRLAGRRARDTHDDLVQAALEQVCRSIASFEGRSRLSTFIFGIVHRVVARAHRYERVRCWFREEAEEATLPEGTAPPDDLYEQARGLAEARAALGKLGAEERAAFVLHELEELPLDEVATAIGCSTRTVKRRLRTARDRLLRAPGPS